RCLVEHHINMAAEKVLHCRSGAAVGDKRNRNTSDVLKKDPADVTGRANAGRADDGFVRLQPTDELNEIFRRYGVLRNDQLRAARQQNNWLQILEQIVMQIVNCAVEYICTPVAKNNGVAIRRGTNGTFDADASAGAAHVLDDNRLSEDLAQGLRQ